MPASGGSSVRTVVKHARDVIRIGDICREHPDLAAVLIAHRLDALLRGFTGWPSSGQHEMTGTVRGQILGNLQSDAPSPPVTRYVASPRSSSGAARRLALRAATAGRT